MFKKSRMCVFLVAVFSVFALTLFGCGSPQETPQQQTVEINVSAAASLKDALTEAQQIYEGKEQNVKLVFNFASSGALQKQIEQGAPADLFISAAQKQMDGLAAKDLIQKDTRIDLVVNKLVMVAPQDSKLALNSFEDILDEGVKQIGIGEIETVPAGQYTVEVLKNLEIWEKVKDKVVMAKDVRSVLTYVETGNVEVGFVYNTDALISDKVKVVASAPEGSHKPIVYPAAVLSEAKQAKAALEFLAFLRGAEGKAIFEKYGFVMGS